MIKLKSLSSYVRVCEHTYSCKISNPNNDNASKENAVILMAIAVCNSVHIVEGCGCSEQQLTWHSTGAGAVSALDNWNHLITWKNNEPCHNENTANEYCDEENGFLIIRRGIETAKNVTPQTWLCIKALTWTHCWQGYKTFSRMIVKQFSIFCKQAWASINFLYFLPNPVKF